MPCTRPLKGWRAKSVGESGKRKVVFNHREAFTDLPVDVPCGSCDGCRLEHSRQWAVRLMHEKSLCDYDQDGNPVPRDACFLTLTYDDAHLPRNGSLDKSEVQRFFKRLRIRLKRAGGPKVRYFAAGEYGETSKRAHYHAIVFGWSPPDGIEYRGGPNPLYVSPLLDKLWGCGQCTFGQVTFETAAYVARYTLKKVGGGGATDFYRSVDWSSGELGSVIPEFALMSQSLGVKWYEKFPTDVFPRDYVISRGHKASVPRAYLQKLETTDPVLAAEVRASRSVKFAARREEFTPERLDVLHEYNRKIQTKRPL